MMKIQVFKQALLGLLLVAPLAFAQDKTITEGQETFLRDTLQETLFDLENMGNLAGLDPAILEQVKDARAMLQETVDADMMADPQMFPGVLRLSEAVDRLQELMYTRLDNPKSPNKSGGLPNAVYPFYTGNQTLDVPAGSDQSGNSTSSSSASTESWSILCNTGIRSDANAMFIAYNVFAAAKIIKDIASRGCQQVLVVGAVVGGGGGNCSLCCAVADVVFGLAEAIFDSIILCDNLIDSAEIQGSYWRMEHLHNDLESTQTDIRADIADLDSDLATHDSTIRTTLANHHSHIETDLSNHDTSISNALGDHDTHVRTNLTNHDNHINADLEAHDAHINADLEQHDADIKALLGTVQSSLDNSVELRQVHMKVVEIKEKREFLVTTTEAGAPVAVTFTDVKVANAHPVSGFTDVLNRTSISELAPGVYHVSINLPKGPVDDLFLFRVRHDEAVVDHYGFKLFKR